MTAIAKLYGNYSLKNGGVVVPTESMTPEMNLREAIRSASGQFQPTFAAAIGAEPRAVYGGEIHLPVTVWCWLDVGSTGDFRFTQLA